MADKIKLKISPAVAVFASPGVCTDEKLKGLGAIGAMAPKDQVMLCYCLGRDRDSVVRETAARTFSSLTEKTLLLFIDRQEIHPAILDTITRVHYNSQEVATALLKNESLSPQAGEFLNRLARESSPSTNDITREADVAEDDLLDDALLLDEEENTGDEAATDDEESKEPEEESEEFRSKYQIAQTLGIAEKIKMALTGDKEWRAILIKDANKLVSGAVVKNPRISDGEIVNILKVGVQNDEIIRVICANKEWIKNGKIRKALVESPKTPLPNALRYLASLSEKEIAGYAKSKNISSVLSTQAKRIMLNKKR